MFCALKKYAQNIWWIKPFRVTCIIKRQRYLFSTQRFMKTSFYFVLWIAIYPILDLLGLQDQSFMIALITVFGLSWLLNSKFSALTTYDRLTQAVPAMEDVYTGNVASIINRLTRELIVETATAIYLLIATAIMGYMVFINGSSELFALIIFGLITVGAIIRSNKIHKTLFALKSNPTPDNFAKMVSNVYQINYAAYHENRQTRSYEEILPPRPKYYAVFRAISFIFAIACIILGSLFTVSSLLPMILEGFSIVGLFYTMRFLYGSLALYFGIKDIAALLSTRKKRKA